MSRVTRRHHYKRLKRKRSGYWFGREIKMTPRILGMVTATPHPCSCLGCGNLRKHIGEKTMQERRYFQEN